MALTIETLLESITESIRNTRRWGQRSRPNEDAKVTRLPIFPTPFDLSQIRWDNETRRIELDLLDNGVVRKFDLLLDEVEYHGQTSDTGVVVEDGDTVSNAD